MLFEYDLTIPAGTAKTAPAQLSLPLDVGIIHQLEVQFPRGCGGLVSVVLKRGVHQVHPANPQGALKGDGLVISGQTWEPVEEAPFELIAEGWAPSSLFAHTVTIRLWQLRREVLQPPSESAGILKRIGNALFGGGA